MRLLSGKIEDNMKYIGYYQLAGGFLGIILTLRIFSYEPSFSGLSLLFYAIAFLLFGFSIYCGNLLRKGNTKGLLLSTFNQILQILQFSISIIGFTYYSGICFSLGFQWIEKFIPDFNIALSQWQFRYTENDMDHLSVYINIVPLLIIYFIWKIEKNIDDRKELMESAKQTNLNVNTET